jgi:hypothetical protein
MPLISHFYGILIYMYFELAGGKHHKPHFHAIYNEHEASISFDGKIIEGSLPPKQLKIVAAWAAIHEDDLNAAWKLATSGQLPFEIEPLK